MNSLKKTGFQPKIVVLISGNGSNLQALIDATKNGRLSANITAVISNNAAAGGLVRAENSNVLTNIIDHRKYNNREDFDIALAEKVTSYSPDLIVLAGFMRILGSRFVDHFVGKIINIHPSLLPKYPGLNTHQRALDAGENETGATVHFVTSNLDGGPIIVQAPVSINPNETANMVAKRVLEAEHLIFPMAAQWFCQKRLIMRNGRAWLDNNVLPPTGKVYKRHKTEK